MSDGLPSHSRTRLSIRLTSWMKGTLNFRPADVTGSPTRPPDWVMIACSTLLTGYGERIKRYAPTAKAARIPTSLVLFIVDLPSGRRDSGTAECPASVHRR